MMEKRYQVFVSSTFQDLQEERKEVIQALLELDCIPAGMELFPAANESQWVLIKKVIEQSDYYILIIGGRYGSLGPKGLSFTEMEYRYALSIGKPIIAFLHQDPGSIPSSKCESSTEKKKKLTSFRNLVKNKLCKFWSTPQELGSIVSRSLVQLIKSNPATGWVRADQLPDRDATLELLRLKDRNEALEKELEHSRTHAPKGTEDLAQGDDTVIINFKFEVLNKGAAFSDDPEGHWTNCALTWHDIFDSIAPCMINEATEEKMKQELAYFVAREQESKILQQPEFLGKELESLKIWEDDFTTILIQLKALRLIKKSDKQHSVKDHQLYWTLTPYGEEILTQSRAIRKSTRDSCVKPQKPAGK